ncbi:hypothetical protein C8C92_1816 [Janthinobacterium sp. 78]|jgi:predicted RNA-binding Zn-ribbon protein involved in translation (DUF1610 family)|nr:hypothetical protein C8C92_1816 [Janthinobacterium sp. 78]
MSTTKRIENKCMDCEYTWFPRGKDLSIKCPNCGNRNIGFSSIGRSGMGYSMRRLLSKSLMILGVVIIGFVAFGPRMEKEAPSAKSLATETEPTASGTELPPSAAPRLKNSIVVNEEIAPPQTISVQPLPMAQNERVVTEDELKLSQKVFADSLLALQACDDSTDDESKSRCIALQCAKAELAPTLTCMDRQAKE